jgi:sugar phosphate isomerase/epimerase
MTLSDTISRRGFLAASAGCGAAAIMAERTAVAAETKSNNTWQIGIYTRPWDQHEYRVALDAIAEAGFKHVGLMTTKSETRLVISRHTAIEEAATIGAECKKRGLAIPSAYCGGIPVHESVEAGIAGLRQLIDNCAAAGVADLMMAGVTEPDLFAPYYESITECCPYAKEKGIGMSMKPHGGSNATGPECRKIIDGIGSDNFRLWYDPGNIFYYSDGKLDPIDDSKTVDGLVCGMSVKDYLHPKNVALTPGTGLVGFPKVMANLNAGGFTSGPLIIECLKPGDLAGLLSEARKARTFIETLVAEKTGQ